MTASVHIARDMPAPCGTSCTCLRRLVSTGICRTEQAALDNAVAKLAVIGPNLGYPHTSDVRAETGIRELRPRAGRSPWRALYRQATETTLVITAVSPEAQHDAKRFVVPVAMR